MSVRFRTERLPMCQIPRNLLLREAMSWRAHDLLHQAYVLHKNSETLGARILVRSALETLAVLIYLNQITTSVVENLKPFAEFCDSTPNLF